MRHRVLRGRRDPAPGAVARPGSTTCRPSRCAPATTWPGWRSVQDPPRRHDQRGGTGARAGAWSAATGSTSGSCSRSRSCRSWASAVGMRRRRSVRRVPSSRWELDARGDLGGEPAAPRSPANAATTPRWTDAGRDRQPRLGVPRTATRAPPSCCSAPVSRGRARRRARGAGPRPGPILDIPSSPG